MSYLQYITCGSSTVTYRCQTLVYPCLQPPRWLDHTADHATWSDSGHWTSCQYLSINTEYLLSHLKGRTRIKKNKYMLEDVFWLKRRCPAWYQILFGTINAKKQRQCFRMGYKSCFPESFWKQIGSNYELSLFSDYKWLKMWLCQLFPQCSIAITKLKWTISLN